MDKAMKEMAGDDQEEGVVTLAQFEEWYRASPEGQEMERKKQEGELKRAVGNEQTHLNYLNACRMLLEELYDDRTLAYMALYLEYVIKHDLGARFGLNEAGPSDLCSQVLQFGKTYALDLLSQKRVKKAAAAVSLTTHNDIGGWNVQEVGQASSSRRRGPPPKGGGDAAGGGTDGGGGDDGPDGGAAARSPSPLDQGCSPLLRPYRLIGLDISEMLRAADTAVQRFQQNGEEEEEEAVGFANPLMALTHSVQTAGEGDFFVGAIQ